MAAGRTSDDEPRVGTTSDELAREFDGLQVWHLTVPVARRAAGECRDRLIRLSDGYRPADMLRIRGQGGVHQAYRAFARQVGLDPDADLTGAEAVAREAMVAGRLNWRGAVPDALLAVLVGSDIPVHALDAGVVDGPLALRGSGPGERLGTGRRATALAPGSLVVADGREPRAVLFAPPPAEYAGTKSRVVTLYALRAPGMSHGVVMEAVWTAGRYLRGD